MPFGLKNVGATYQRAMVTLFHDMMHREVEVYVDDILAKSKKEEDHVQVLRRLFERLQKYQLKLNLAKCSFGVKTGKLLGFIVSDRGIEVDPDKAKAIQEMPAPKIEKEVRSFLGRLNYIARFISQLTVTCEPIFHLLKKKNHGVWDNDCQEAFDKIKWYLQNPPLLVPPTPGKPLILYLTVTETAMGYVLGQHDESGRKEQAIYYLRKKFNDYPLKYICEKPYLSSRIARWQVLLAEYDIVFMTRKAVKESVIADHLADHAMENYKPLNFDLPDEDVIVIENGGGGSDQWTLYFDGAINVSGNMAGAVDEKLKLYQNYLLRLANEFEEIKFTHISKNKNQFASALATLASMTQVDTRSKIQPIDIEVRRFQAHCCLIEESPDGKPWYNDIKKFLQNREYPQGISKTDEKTLRRMTMNFYLDEEILYKRSFYGTLLRCLNENEIEQALKEVHEGICATHANGHTMAKQIQRSGYFWLTMEKDCIDYVRKFHKCQIYGDKINAPPTPLFNMISPWPFDMWGSDVIGPINPKASNGHRFVLVAIDYFTKWVEANSYAHVTQKVVKRFIEEDLVCRYGLPTRLVTDNAQNFNGKLIDELCTKWKIKHLNSSPYRPKMNGAVEAANKNLKKIIQNMVVTYKDWHEMLSYAFHAYRTTVRTSTNATPYSLVYGMEAIMPLEVEIPSMRILKDAELDESEWARLRFEQLNLIDERRLAAICHHQLYQSRIAKAYNKKVKPRVFKEGDLVLKKISLALGEDQSKWAPNYEGPYVVKKAFSGGALILTNMDGKDLLRLVNSDIVKKY
eukprot:XP_024441595.1 uncharacterized protein LOC112324178 [Populus trichocarpa]